MRLCLLSLFCLTGAITAWPQLNSDSLNVQLYEKSVSQHSGADSGEIAVTLDAARALAAQGLYSEALDLLIPLVDSTAAGEGDTAGSGEEPAARPAAAAPSVAFSVAAGMDYYGYEDSDSLLYYQYGDTASNETGALDPLDIYAEAAMDYRPTKSFLRKISPYLKIAKLSRRERISLDMGPPDRHVNLYLKEQYTQYLGRVSGDSSDPLELNGGLNLTHPFPFSAVEVSPALNLTADLEKYRFERSGYVSNAVASASPGLGISTASFSGDAAADMEWKRHPAGYDSLNTVTLRPRISLDWVRGNFHLNLSGEEETVRWIGKVSGDDGYGMVQVNLDYAFSPRLSLLLSASLTNERSGSADTFYTRNDSLFFNPPLSLVDTLMNVINFDTAVEKYSLQGTRKSITPELQWHITGNMSLGISYEIERGTYADVKRLHGSTLQYPIPAIDDSYLRQRIALPLNFSCRFLECRFEPAVEGYRPSNDHPFTPANAAIMASLSLLWTLHRGLLLNAYSEIESRAYESGKDDLGNTASQGEHVILNKIFNLSLQKQF